MVLGDRVCLLKTVLHNIVAFQKTRGMCEGTECRCPLSTNLSPIELAATAILIIRKRVLPLHSVSVVVFVPSMPCMRRKAVDTSLSFAYRARLDRLFFLSRAAALTASAARCSEAEGSNSMTSRRKSASCSISSAEDRRKFKPAEPDTTPSCSSFCGGPMPTEIVSGLCRCSNVSRDDKLRPPPAAEPSRAPVAAATAAVKPPAASGVWDK